MTWHATYVQLWYEIQPIRGLKMKRSNTKPWCLGVCLILERTEIFGFDKVFVNYLQIRFKLLPTTYCTITLTSVISPVSKSPFSVFHLQMAYNILQRWSTMVPNQLLRGMMLQPPQAFRKAPPVAPTACAAPLLRNAPASPLRGCGRCGPWVMVVAGGWFVGTPKVDDDMMIYPKIYKTLQ